jgi:hypothetical protein
MVFIVKSSLVKDDTENRRVSQNLDDGSICQNATISDFVDLISNSRFIVVFRHPSNDVNHSHPI